MCFQMPFRQPHPVFETLEKGTEVKLLQGAGFPEVDEDEIIEVMIDIDGSSGMTNTGRLLMCSDGNFIQPTGRILDESEYEVAEVAREALEKIYEEN